MGSIRKVTGIFLCLILIITTLVVPIGANAVVTLYVRRGYINDDVVNIRSGAGTQNESLGKLSVDTAVIIDGIGFDSAGEPWYALTAYTSSGEIRGYVHSDYVTPTSSDTTYTAETIKDSTLRTFPGTWNESAGVLTKGNEVVLIGSQDDADGDMWYHIRYESDGSVKTAYIYHTAVEIVAEYEEDIAFEEMLDKEGFPESYKPYLRNLHAIYPNWVFRADILELSWEEAVKGETQYGRSAVSSYKSEAWKSLAEGCYDWKNGEYKTIDSGGWVNAAESVVEYYLDPRNFLNSSSIFQFISMEYDETLHTKERVLSAVRGTFLENDFPEEEYETYVDVLIAAAKESGVSPISLASMIIVEQGSSGGGNSISGKYPGYAGYYNFYNIRAYRNGGYNAIQYGLLYAKGGDGSRESYYRPWDNRADSIIGGAVWYSDQYMAKGQDTLYYKKFNVVKKPYFSHEYMTNIEGAYSESSKTASGYKNIMNEALVFDIPVYKKMPENAAPYPTKTGNNDCYLSSLSIEGGSLTPSFYRYTNEYEIVVPHDADTVTISYNSSDEASTVTGGGEIKLNYGNNKAEIKVVSSSGIENVYTVYIYRNAPPDAQLSINPINLKINGNYVRNINVGTSADKIVAEFNIIGGSGKVITGTTGVVGTGDIIEIFDSDGNLTYTYTILMESDLNGDGDFDLSDVACLQSHLLNKEVLQGAYFACADRNNDGKVGLMDLAIIYKEFIYTDW